MGGDGGWDGGCDVRDGRRTGRPRPRPGDDQLAGDRVRRRRAASSALAQREIGLRFPQPGWVEQDPLEIWEAQRETAVEALRSSGAAARRGGRRRHHQPARDHRSSGTGRTSLPIAPAIVWQDRRTAERCDELRRGGHEDLVRRKTGLRARPVLLGHQDRLAARQRARRPRAGRARRAGLRHRGQLAGVAAHRRPPARHRRHQRLAHAALRPARRRLGRRAARALRRAARAAARGPRHQRRGGSDGRRPGDVGSAVAVGAGPSRGHGRRPAVGALRAGLHRARRWPRSPTAPAASCC